MHQEMGWFDRKENSIGALSARLAGDAASVQGAIGFPLSNIIQAFTNFICSISIAFPYSWELALICLSTSPFMIASIVFEARFGEKSALKEKAVLEETSRIATETITQIRTVAGLRREEGQTVALVGPSGCGKSTCIQLLQRFYDPVFGQVLLDGEDVRKYNLNWLRSNIAVVGQEPVLFQGTIGENIRHGKPEATQKEVEDSAKAANAHDFIVALHKVRFHILN